MGVMDRYNEKKKKEQNTSNSAFASGGVMQRYNLYKTIGNVDYDVNEDFINTFITDANSFLESAEKDYGSVGWGNATSSYDSRYNSWKDIYSRSVAIRRWIDNNRRNLDEDTYNSLSEALNSYNSGVSSTLDAFKSAKDYFGQWETEDAYNTYAAEQEWLKSDDFQEYSQKGREVANPAWDDTEAPLDIFGWKPFGEGETVNNMVTFAEANQGKVLGESANALRGGGQTSERSQLLNLINLYMKEDEKAIYNYYIGKGEVDKANEYLNNLSDVLRYRQAEGMATQVDDSEMLAMLFAAAAGLDQFASGIRNIDNFFTGAEADPTSATQYASSMIREKLDGGWGVAYDAISTTANMLPSVLVSFVPVVGKPLGLATMGTSAVGNAYAEMRNLNYDEGQSRAYAALVGASEMVLQSLLGGISKLGGKHSLSAGFSKLVSKVDNAFAKVAIKLGGNMASEGLEEAIQTALEPVFKAWVTGEDIEGAEWDEILYSALLGALSSGLMEGAPTIIGTAKSNIGAKKIYGSGKDLVAEGLEIGGDAGALAEKYQKNRIDKSKNLTGSQINHLNEEIFNSNVTKLKDSIGQKLTEYGETGKKSKITDALANYAMGKKSTSKDTRTLNKSKKGYLVATELDPKNIESGGLANKWSEKIGTTRINPKAYNKEWYEANKLKNGVKVVELPSAAGEPPEREFEVSESGKTIQISTGEAITIDKNNPIATTKVVDGQTIVYFNTNQGKIASTDISYANEAEGMLYEGFADINPAIASAVIKNYDGSVPVETYIKGMREGITLYGRYNFQAVGKDIPTTSDIAQLSDTDQAFALKLGKSYAQTVNNRESQALRTSLKEAAKNADAEATASDKKQIRQGRVNFEYGARAKGKQQKHIVSLAKMLSKAIGIDFYFYDSTIPGTPESQSNGYFNPKDNSIHLDLQNSMTDAKTIAYSMSHELVHFIKKWSPAKFKVFADFLIKHYGENGVDTDGMLKRMMAKLNTTDVDAAFEEVICEACERMLLDSNAAVKLAQLRTKDAGLVEKIKAHILGILNRIRGEYKKYSPSSEQAQALDKIGTNMEEFYALFEDMAVDAAQTYQEAVSLNAESVVMTEDGTIKLQMKQYEQTGRATLYKYLQEQYGEKNAKDLISTIDNIYDVLKEVKKNEALSVFSNWQDTEVELDENGHPIFTTSINNGDYELNQDFSRVCKKRRQLDFVLNMLAEDPAFEASNLTKQDFVKINNAIKSHGFEIACALCFVDSKRFRQAEWADSFANTWNDILNAVVTDSSKLTPFNFATKNPNISDDGIEIDTSKSVSYRKWSDGKEVAKDRRTYDSLEQMLSKEVGADGKEKWFEGNANVRTIATLIRDNPQLRHTFRGADIIASQGFDTIQRLAPGIRNILDGWGGSSVPKPSSNDASYDSSILNLKGYNKETAYAMGGVRMNSFSDFMAHMFFDYCQAFADLSAKELPSQAYTKELIYVRFFGRSGQKINMSGIAAIRDNALPTSASKSVSKAEAEANEKIEKMVAGLDVTRLLEHLNKDIYQITEADVEQFLDMCDYVWADESIDMKHATLLQTGILYDKLTDSKIEECYELLKAGETEKALQVAGEENVDTEYAKHCGTIVVGVSDAHIRKLLRDPTIRMVIPYHKSGLNPIIARELRIAAYNDYTPVQNTGVVRKGSKARSNLTSTEIKDAYGLKDFAFYDWFGKTIDGKVYDGKATADKYLEWCEKGYYDESVGDYVYYTTKAAGYILASELHKKLTIEPKFNSFIGEENYYKLLEDFDCYNTITGEHSEQGAVDFLRKGLPSDYKDVLMDALKAEQKVHDDFRDHLDNKGLKDEIMEIAKPKTAPKTIEGVKRQAKPSQKDPSLLDPRTVTESDVVELLNNVNAGAYDDGTNIPLRTNTPPMLIYWAKKKRGDVIDNNPISMSVGKAYQAMAQKRLGDESRPHKLSVNDMIAVIKKMNAPQYIVYQGANGRYVEVIDHVTEDGRKVFAILEIGEFKDTPYMNGYEGDIYNVLVTTFSPDAGKLGELLNNPQNKVVYNKEKDLSQGTSGSMVPSVLNDKPFYEDSITQEEPIVKRQLKNPSNRSLLAGALESVAENDIERAKLVQYKERIALIESEQKKLSEIRAKAKELRFTKGRTPSETKQMRDLDFEANQIANRINTYDKQLLNLESTKALKNVLEREKKILRKRLEQKGKEALNAYKERAADTVRELMTRNTESRKKAIEGRHKTELRNKLKSTIADLRKILNHGTKERNVKIELQESVSKALALADVLLSDEYNNEAIVRLGVESVTEKEAEMLAEYSKILEILEPYRTQLETMRQELVELRRNKAPESEIEALKARMDEIRNLPEYTKASNKKSALNTALADVFVRERNRYDKEKAVSIMDALVKAYESLQNSDVDYIKGAYSSELRERLVAIRSTFDNVSIKDMSLKNLEEIYKAFSMVKHVITEANSLFRNGRKEDLGKRIKAVQNGLRSMNKEGKDRPAFFDKITGLLRSFSWNNLRPVDAFERLGVDAFTELYWDAVSAQDTYARDIVEAGEVISKAREKYQYKKWDLKTAKTFKTANGLEFKLTLGDIMSIYAYSFREQAYEHMSIGGFTFDTGKTYKEKKNGISYTHAKLSDTYIVNDFIIQEIIASLDEGQRAYVKEIQKYLTELGAKGNEVARILYGIDLFTEEHYFPLQSETDYRSSVEQALNATQTMASLKNTGMAKPTVPHASNPIVLKSFDDVVLEHIDKMSKYHAYVIPIENMQKVFNNSNQEDIERSPISTQALISSIFGREATAYFNQYITDLNGGSSISGAKNPLASFFGKAKGVSVAANLSVVAQQYFAVVRAMAEINPVHFIPFLNGSASKSDGSSYEELKKYAPVAIIKEMGGFDVGSNSGAKDYIGSEGTPLDGKKVWNKFQDFTMLGASLMDKFGWVTIWKAVKKEVASTRKDLTVGSEEFLKAAGERFREVVTKTQVYDSVNTRSGYMRSKHDSVKYLTSFMGEPTVSIGMFFTSTNNFLRAIRNKDKVAAKKALGKMARVYAVLPAAGIMTAIAKSLVQALRDDDEDETFREKWIEHYASNLKDDLNPLNYLPIGRDIMSIINGWDVERPDMTLISDLITSAQRVFDEDATGEEILGAVEAIANMLGIPLKNVIRDARGFINTIGNGYGGDSTDSGIKEAWNEGWTGEGSSTSKKLYQAIINGDKARLELYKSKYDTEKDYETAVKKALRENDPRIKEAAQARYDGNIAEYKRIAKEIIAEGNFSQDIVVGAINAAVNAIKKGETTETEQTEDKDEATSIYKASDLNAAFESGDNTMALEIIEDLVKTKVENGKTEKEAKSSVRSSMTSYWKPLYLQAYKSGNNAEMQRIRKILYASGLYGSGNEVVKTVQGWLNT